jgi:hypothetical protein
MQYQESPGKTSFRGFSLAGQFIENSGGKPEKPECYPEGHGSEGR